MPCRTIGFIEALNYLPPNNWMERTRCAAAFDFVQSLTGPLIPEPLAGQQYYLRRCERRRGLWLPPLLRIWFRLWFDSVFRDGFEWLFWNWLSGTKLP